MRKGNPTGRVPAARRASRRVGREEREVEEGGGGREGVNGEVGVRSRRMRRREIIGGESGTDEYCSLS